MAMKWDKCRFCDRSPSKRSCCTAVPLYRCKTTYRIIILLSDHRSKGTELATSDGRCSTLLRLLLPLPLPFTAISESGVSFRQPAAWFESSSTVISDVFLHSPTHNWRNGALDTRHPSNPGNNNSSLPHHVNGPGTVHTLIFLSALLVALLHFPNLFCLPTLFVSSFATILPTQGHNRTLPRVITHNQHTYLVH